MDEFGRTHLRTYNPPRRVTYFVNLLTVAVNGQSDDGYDWEFGKGRWADDPLANRMLACPRSSSKKLEAFVGDKLLTRILMSGARVAVPTCLAFVYQPNKKYPPAPIVPVVWDDLGDIDWGEVERDVAAALPSFGRKTSQVVVKPSGPLWYGCRGVSFQPLEAAAIVAAVKALSAVIHPGDAILVDEFCATVPAQDVLRAKEVPLRAALDPGYATETRGGQAVDIIKAEQQLHSAASAAQTPRDKAALARREKLASIARTQLKVRMQFRVRVIVHRLKTGEPAVGKFVCAVGPGDEPLHGSNSIPQTLALTLQQWGFTKAGATEVRELIAADARASFRALDRYEQRLTPAERGGPRAATDMIGIDVLLSQRDGVIVPIVIEVNDHDCVHHSIVLEMMDPAERGEAMREYTRTMLYKAQRFSRIGAVLVAVGAGGSSKAFIWQALREERYHVVIVDHDADHFGQHIADAFVHVPEMEDHAHDERNAGIIVAALAAQGYTADTIDGCLTYWEDCSPLASRVCSLLGVPGNSVAAHTIAKSKYATHEFLAAKEEDFVLTVPSLRVGSLAEIRAAKKNKFRMPALLKLEYGSSGVGVLLVESWEEAEAEFTRLTTELASEADHAGCGLSFGAGPSMVLMEYVGGSEHQIDILMHDGAPIFHAISDYSPTKIPYFSELAITMPTRLHPQRERTLVYCTAWLLRKMGLNTGAFNVGFKFTKRGPRLIEVNARMGGFCLQDWIKRIYGVDMAKCAATLACGSVPAGLTQPAPSTTIVGVMLYASDAAEQLKSGALDTLERLHSSSNVIFNRFEDHIPDKEDAEEFEEPLANLACEGDTFESARDRLVAILGCMNIMKAGDTELDWYIDSLC
eukprot:TRINITY_DN312_c0_g1_i1.p2 TRINITY_DN312_c0_g1~~TRINITY_DN312_c0_g1_i1.p2  ORF type:complete len:1003 (+),score=415.85 TRINITY_DN312_c0_g1_i1:420-3011(+)